MTYPAGQTVPQDQPAESTDVKADPPGNTVRFPTGEELRRNEETKIKQQAFLNTVPEPFRLKEYVQNIAKTEDPMTEFHKSYESAQSMIGQRNQPVQPLAADATPEQRSEYYKKIGVSEDLNDYIKIDNVTWEADVKDVGDFVTSNRSAPLVEGLAKEAQALGITDKQFKGLVPAYEKLLVSQNKDALKEQVKRQAQMKSIDEDYSKEINKLYGPRSEVVVQNGRKMLEESVPVSIRAKISELSNDAILVLAAALDSTHAKYVREGTFTGTAGSGAAPSKSLNDLSIERQAIYASKAWNEPGHPQHKEARAKERANDAETRKAMGLSPP